MSRLEAVLFELDGVLAKTGIGAPAASNAAALLAMHRKHGLGSLSRGPQVAQIPGRLISRGYRVGILSRRVSMPYASTMLGLLGVDYDRLFVRPGWFEMADLADELGVPVRRLLYVAAEQPQADQAEAFGAAACVAPWLSGGEVRLAQLGRAIPPRRLGKDPLQVLVSAEGGAHDLATAISRLRSSVRQLNSTSSLSEGVALTEVGSCDVERVRQALRDGCLSGQQSWQAVVASGQAAAVATALLSRNPGQPDRRRLQMKLFATLPAASAGCLLRVDAGNDRAGFPGWLITRSEYDQNQKLRAALLGALRRLLPAQPLTRIQGGHACTPYHSELGTIWSRAKMWRGSASGPEVRLSLMELPALTLAAHAQRWAADCPELVVTPVPASPFSFDRPGQMSERLAARVADIARLDYRLLLRKEDGDITARKNGRTKSHRVLLVEDQITGGRKAAESVRVLRAQGHTVLATFAWSASAPLHNPINESECWLEDALDEFGVDVQCPRHHLAESRRNFAV